ncbi:MAG: hypothetical protein ACLU38_09075 [Dysosmobacter sp.]
MNYLQELWAALDFGSLRDIYFAGIGVPVFLTTHDLPRAGGLRPGRPHHGDAQAESESPAAHRLDGSADDVRWASAGPSRCR